MQAAEGGRHCERCDRVVRDLTGMDEAGILRLMAREPELCGRVRQRSAPRLGLSLALLVLAGCTPWGVQERLEVIEPGQWHREPAVPEQIEPVPELSELGEIGIGGFASGEFSMTVGAMVAVTRPPVEAGLGEATVAESDELPFTLSGEVKVDEAPRRGHRRRRP